VIHACMCDHCDSACTRARMPCSYKTNTACHIARARKQRRLKQPLAVTVAFNNQT
jgi:hypothetical protein